MSVQANQCQAVACKRLTMAQVKLLGSTPQSSKACVSENAVMLGAAKLLHELRISPAPISLRLFLNAITLVN